MHLHTQEPVFDISDYAGQVYCGQSQMYEEPRETEFRISGTRPVQLVVAGNFWYNNQPVFKAESPAQVMLGGNSGGAGSAAVTPALVAMLAGLDDLRRLGELDLRLANGPVK